MEALKELNDKHSVIKEKLATTAKAKISKGTIMAACTNVGRLLEISPQTVYNYITGNIKDGYLAEAILKEFKRLKRSNN